jgi:hypothetical protein
MGNIRHKWIVLMVVLVTTLATAQEAVRQYDGLREQANEWASSRLLASLLNTSAPAEASPEAQTTAVAATITSCSAEERKDLEPSVREQSATLSLHQLIETKSAEARPVAGAATRIALDEIPAPLDRQHVELGEADRETLEAHNEIALLTNKNHEVELPESLDQSEEIEAPERAPVEHDTDYDSSVHATPEMHFINRIITAASPRVSETDIEAVRARAAADALVQTRAARKALKVLQERSGRPIRLELKIIRKGDQPGGIAPLPPAAPLRAANSASRTSAAPLPDESPAPPALHDLAAEIPNSACASE